MIGRLFGTLLAKHPPQLLLDVNGVGYELDTPMSTFYRLPEIGAKLTLHTHLVVREDAHLLYGFFEQKERTLFRALIKVNGVGPKVALAILSGIEADNFIRHILENNASGLTRIPGIGKKTAERLIIEMRDRLKDSEWEGGIKSLPLTATAAANHPIQEAVSALIALGFKPQQASRAVANVEQSELSSEELIRMALKSMVD